MLTLRKEIIKVNSQILQNISIVAFIMGGIFLAIALLLFFLMDVRGLIDDLSGKSAKRQIRQLREQNRQKEKHSNDKFLFESYLEKDNVTAKLSKNKMNKEQDSAVELSEQKTTLLKNIEETEVLTSEDETTLLLESRLILNEIIIHTKERI